MDPEWPPVKTQSIRIIDVLVVGPLMLLGAKALADRGKPATALALGLFGFGTIVYNAQNYAIIERRLRA